ncbi:hypothetical protein FB559_5576 [Actinoallomurus bryophytorum]|uniref:Uncharacterized protein n=1 Tax=Actinoallomurus bryophytorum TaxID=1490222 RepID=A0A543CRY4_9ACTN|nr:hypothetical protein FB559_5576 [Actinoallomurus bryophytorum]
MITSERAAHRSDVIKNRGGTPFAVGTLFEGRSVP